MDEADLGFQLLSDEIVESLNERNENETDLDEEGGDNATNTKPPMVAKAFESLETVIKLSLIHIYAPTGRHSTLTSAVEAENLNSFLV